MISSRIARLRADLHKRGLDALLVSSLPNIRYLSNFSGSNALCIIKQKEAFFLTDSRYTLQSSAEVRGLRRRIAPITLTEGVARLKLLAGCKHVGFEAHVVTYAQYRVFKKMFPDVSFHSTSDLVETIALVKEDVEVAAIQKAVDISDRVYHDILDRIRPGMRELDVAAEISYLHKSHGADRDAFDVIVASGKRGALPHARPTMKRIGNGELVTLDFGCTIQGYSSDITRTIAIGRASRRAKTIYQVVLDAQREAIAAAKAGLWARDLDAIARKCIRSAGYGRYFSHSLGHGLGLHVHERPRVSALSKERLQSRSVITIEPGIYIPGFGGVRIEDDVLLDEHGCRVLNASPKEFTIV